MFYETFINKTPAFILPESGRFINYDYCKDDELLIDLWRIVTLVGHLTG